MKEQRKTPSLLCEAQELLGSLTKEFRVAVCARLGWTEAQFLSRVRCNSSLNRLQAWEVAAIKKAVLAKALESCE